MLRHINLIFILLFLSLSSSAGDSFSFYDEKESFLLVEEAFQFSLLPDKDESIINIEVINLKHKHVFSQGPSSIHCVSCYVTSASAAKLFSAGIMHLWPGSSSRRERPSWGDSSALY